jgi:hypothetical protein
MAARFVNLDRQTPMLQMVVNDTFELFFLERGVKQARVGWAGITFDLTNFASPIVLALWGHGEINRRLTLKPLGRKFGV